MTDREFNERLEQLEKQRTELLSEKNCRNKTRRNRRENKVRKDDKLLRVITRHYVPHAGYVDWGFDGDTLLHSGKYIKYPKNSNCQRWMKRLTSRRFRRCKALPNKGNHYRRLFDYWWTLY